MATTPPSPSPSPSPSTLSLPLLSDSPPISFNLPFIVMVLLFLSTAFLILKTCCLFVSRCRRHPLLPSYSSPNFNTPASSPNSNIPALTDTVIKTLPLSIYTRESNAHECAVCLHQFEENDSVRTLPVCYHAYHADCVDKWLRLNATCPLCYSALSRREIISPGRNPGVPSEDRFDAKITVKINGVKDFTYGELALAAKNFEASAQVGQGGYGKVYKGTLADGTIVAIKCAQEGSLGGDNEFLTEKRTIVKVTSPKLGRFAWIL